MKNVSVLLISFLITLSLSAEECKDFYILKDSRKFFCQTSAGEPDIITNEGRIIFVSKTACLEFNDNELRVNLINPGNGMLEMKMIYSSDNKWKARNSYRIYPSGNIHRSYLREETAAISENNNKAIELKIIKRNKFLLKNAELRYFGDYSCFEN